MRNKHETKAIDAYEQIFTQGYHRQIILSAIEL